MFTIHATRKLLDRVKRTPVDPVEQPSTSMGNWYANLVGVRPQVAIFVNETTLVPMLLSVAPAKAIATRLVTQVAAVLEALDAPAPAIRCRRFRHPHQARGAGRVGNSSPGETATAAD